MKQPETLFSEEDQKRISEAVKKAELATSGEIVPYVAGQSDHYPEAGIRLGSLLAFIVLFIFVLLELGANMWLPYAASEAAIIAVVVFGIGMLLSNWVPPLKRALITPGILTQRVEERASMAFLSEAVFNTRERTGILIFLSLFEHRVVVMGDEGINAKVDQNEWDGIVALITQSMKAGTPAEGLIKAIDKCGTLLGDRGIEIRNDDTNELDNSLRMSDK